MYMGPIDTDTATPLVQSAARPPRPGDVAIGIAAVAVVAPLLLLRLLGHLLLRDVGVAFRALRTLGEEIGAARR